MYSSVKYISEFTPNYSVSRVLVTHLNHRSHMLFFCCSTVHCLNSHLQLLPNKKFLLFIYFSNIFMKTWTAVLWVTGTRCETRVVFGHLLLSVTLINRRLDDSGETQYKLFLQGLTAGFSLSLRHFLIKWEMNSASWKRMDSYWVLNLQIFRAPWSVLEFTCVVPELKKD